MSEALKDPKKPSGPVSIKGLKVTVDRDLCIGAATCIAIAPKVFVLDDEAKAIILDTADETDENVIVDAVRGCPTAAISVVGKDGNKIFP